MELRLSAAKYVRLSTLAAGLVAISLASVVVSRATAGTVDRIRDSGHIKLGYLRDAPPFSFANQAGSADGYAVDLCKRLVEHLTRQLALPGLTVDWTPVAFEERLTEVRLSQIDLLCAPTSVTVSRRREVSFSIPIFASGNRAAVRADAPASLRRLLSETPTVRTIWRGTPAATLLEATTFAYVPGTTAERWLKERHTTLQVPTTIASVADYRVGLTRLNAGQIDVLMGDRVVMLGALGVMEDFPRENIVVLDRIFTHEAAALALPRGDEDFRLLVDDGLSRLYASSEFQRLYERWCGEFDERTRMFFQWNTLGP